ncbi:MAG: hypothetical protein GEV08_10685 [Acidimicrobiia bacterium]|nr:hypothetical protein [Acidimicrobiia bacterium]
MRITFIVSGSERTSRRPRYERLGTASTPRSSVSPGPRRGHPGRRALVLGSLEAYGLTDRERQITALVARGLSAAAIRRELFLSEWTVKDNLKTILDKVGPWPRRAFRSAAIARLRGWALRPASPPGGAGRHQVE